MRFPPYRRMILLCAAPLPLIAACSSSTPATPPAPSTAASSPAPAVQPTDASGRVAQWYAGVASLFAAIQSDTEHVKGDAVKQDVASLTTHCTGLRNDAARVQGATAAPDKRIAAAVAAAMSSYTSAAQSCLRGDYAATAKGINAGAADLESANAIMNNLS